MIPPTQKSRELTRVQKSRSCPALGVDRPWVKPHPQLPTSYSGAMRGPVPPSTWQVEPQQAGEVPEQNLTGWRVSPGLRGQVCWALTGWAHALVFNSPTPPEQLKELGAVPWGRENRQYQAWEVLNSRFRTFSGTEDEELTYKNSPVSQLRWCF